MDDERLIIRITDEQGVLYGHIEVTRDEIDKAQRSARRAFDLVTSIAAEVGV